jgi:hypothetical protein
MAAGGEGRLSSRLASAEKTNLLSDNSPTKEDKMKKSFLRYLNLRNVMPLVIFLYALAINSAAQTPQHNNIISAGYANTYPLNQNNGFKCQWLIDPGEYNQPRPAPPGDLTRLYIYMASTAGPVTYTQLTTKMGQTALTSLPGGGSYVGQLDTVYSNPSATLSSTANTWLVLTLNKPFHYNPDQSLVTEISQCVFTYSGQDTRILQSGIDVTPGVSRHAVGDFDGDGKDEVVVDFGAAGAWMYNDGSWTQLTANDPESLMAADVDGDGIDEILADLGSLGLWLWNAGAWNQLSPANVESLAAGDVDADGAEEIVGDFGTLGLWLRNAGVWTQISGANAEYVTTVNLAGSGGDEIVGDFGSMGLWLWSSGTWGQVSGVNADYVATGKVNAGGYLVIDFGPAGLWLGSLGGWLELSGVNADYMITANTDGDTVDEIVGDFGATGLWLLDSGVWTELSGVNAEFMIRADVSGDGKDEIAVDFGSIGLWLWNAGSWSQLSGVNPEYMLAADVDGDGKDEIMVDFGSLGLWLWNEGSWSKISANNPD